jgi:hypothetical protein
VPNGAHLRRAIFEAKRADHVMAEVDRFFAARAHAESGALEPAGDHAEEPEAVLAGAAPAAWG